MRKCEGGAPGGEKSCKKIIEEVCPAVREQRYDKITALCAEEGKY